MFDTILQKIYIKKSKMFFDHFNVWTIIFQKLKKESFCYACLSCTANSKLGVLTDRNDDLYYLLVAEIKV